MQTLRTGAVTGMRAGIVLAILNMIACATPGTASSPPIERGWTTTWATGQSVPAGPAANAALLAAVPAHTLSNQTVRVITRVTLGGDRIRVKLANTFGSNALKVDAASIGVQQAGAALVSGTVHTLTFAGRASISIPIGAYVLSDPVDLPVSAHSNLAISVFTAGYSGPVTVHPMALQTSYLSNNGNFTASNDAAPFVTPVQSWPYVMGIDVHTPAPSRTVVAFGDSITDGYGSATDTNQRWPDYFGNRLAGSHPHLAVVNEGIGGNRLWHDATPEFSFFGPSGLSRFDRDAITVAGVSHIVVLLGINDIGQASPTHSPEEQVSADDIIVGLTQLALRAHAHGIKIIGATLTPYRGAAYFSEAGEAQRQIVNAWIRHNGEFDGCIDFDAAVRDPAAAGKLAAAYDSGDHLHPSGAGYEAMAARIDLSLFD